MSVLSQKLKNLKLTSVVETVHPSLAIRLRTLNRTNVMGLPIIVPRDDLSNINLIADSDQ